MAASTNDLLTQATVNSRPTPTTVTSPRAGAATTLQCNALTGWPTATKVHFCTYKTNTSGAKTAGTQLDWSGIVSGTSITNLVLKAGTDTGNAVGDIVEAAPTAAYANDLYSWGAQDHDTLGRHKDVHGTNGNTVLGLTDGASTVNNARVTASNTGLPVKAAAEGTDANVDFQIAGKGTGKAHVDGFMEVAFDFVVSGGVWSGDAYASTKNASMTAVVCYINGQRGSVAAVTAHVFTASKDTYVDILNTAGVFSLVYTEATNNAASPALAANSLRLGIIVTGASNIAAAGSVNQGQETIVLPIASSVPYAVTDSLGNLICPRDPNRKILGFRQITTSFVSSASSTAQQVTGLSVPVIIPTGRKIRISAFGSDFFKAAGGIQTVAIWDGTVGSGTQLADSEPNIPSATASSMTVSVITTPTSSSKTFNVGIHPNAAATLTIEASATRPCYALVELL